ncbi:MAG TPA: fused MFS/spermidine synthase, partial [Mycobacteriales bacterium]|nr:fused MFS/spermidine synthase [Mycobacteriales bacterium]
GPFGDLMGEAVPVVAEVDLRTATLLPDVDRDRAYLLAIDGVPQSYVDLDDPEHLEFEYVQRFAHLADTLRPGAVLHLGGGGLTLPRYIAATAPTTRQVVVEIDAGLVRLVCEQLPFDERITVHVADGREELERQPSGSFDLIVADIFAGSHIPAAVTSLEFFAEVRRVLRPDGVYVANIADQAPFAFSRALTAGAAATFGECRLVGESSVFRGRRFGNLLLIATGTVRDFSEFSRRLAGDAFPARMQDAEPFVAGAEPIRDSAPVASPRPPEGTFTLP